MRIIGDVHGKMNVYRKLIKGFTTIQVGDLGFYPAHIEQKQIWDSEPEHYIVFGNHDYYPMVNEPYSMNGLYMIENFRVAAIRGADSVDKIFRVKGVDWFENEEQSYIELNDLIANVIKFEPDIIITHDCPQSIVRLAHNIRDVSRTRQALQSLFEQYQPNLWVYGHHHHNSNTDLNGTLFKCLEECAYIDL